MGSVHDIRQFFLESSELPGQLSIICGPCLKSFDHLIDPTAVFV